MIIAEVKGDLVKMLQSAIERDVPFFAAQGCNMQAKQASGIAGQLRAIPEIYEADLKAYRDGEVSPSQPSIAKFNICSNQLFFNLYTQTTPGPTARYDYLDYALDALKEELLRRQAIDCPVFIPQIGCGIGGLDWEEVEYILEESNVRFIVVHYDNSGDDNE